MLSLLSLIIASGTVLRADTELWEPQTYPDPRTNSTECNVPHEGTLCDPDHILTDTWRQTILDNIEQHMAKLENARIYYTDDASPECLSNSTGPTQIFLVLAKRIHAASNQSLTSNDLTQFGHGIREVFGLDTMPCKNYVLVLGVELAKQVYVWTGSDLAIPKEVLDNSLDQYKNLFTERNYMEGLNKIVDEISSLIMDPYKEFSTTLPPETTEDPLGLTTETDRYFNLIKTVIPTWMYVVIAICVVVTLCVLFFFALFVIKYFRNRTKTAHIYQIENNPKSGPIFNVIQKHDSNGNENYQLERGNSINRRKSIDSENSHQPMSEHGESTVDASSIVSGENAPDTKTREHRVTFENFSLDTSKNIAKLALDDGQLSTDRVVARRNSDMRPAPPTIEDNFSSL